MEITAVDGIRLGWGESLVWDERRQRLYFVDCATSSLHWLEGDDLPAPGATGPAPALRTRPMPSLPAGVVPTSGAELVVALDDGLHVVEPDAGETRLLAAYPDRLGGRCNDACADLAGNLITGKLNLAPAEGSAWWYGAAGGWRLIDPDIANTNGPAVGVLDGEMTLILGDTSAQYYRYPYDPTTGAVGPRAVFGDVDALAGAPDGATLDVEGGLWCALVGGSQLARFTGHGLDRTVALPVAHPTDVTFGGPGLDRLFVTSIAAPPGAEPGLDGCLLVIDGLGARGRPEPRFGSRA